MAFPMACRALRLLDLPVCKAMVTSLEGLGCYKKTHYCLPQNGLIDKSDFLNRFLNSESDGRGVATALSSFTQNSTLYRLPPHSNPSPQLPTQVMQQVFECLAWARDWPQLLDSQYLNFSWLIQASPLFWKLQGLPISLAALTSSLLPCPLLALSLRGPAQASLLPLGLLPFACVPPISAAPPR